MGGLGCEGEREGLSVSSDMKKQGFVGDTFVVAGDIQRACDITSCLFLNSAENILDSNISTCTPI